MYCWSLVHEFWTLLFDSLWNEYNCVVVWALFGIAFLWDWNENWHFPVLRPLLSFPNLLAYWMQYFHSFTFRIWNSLTGIPSPPLALFVVMLPKVHLTSDSRMSGCRWVVTSSWLSGHEDLFLYSSSVNYCHLLIASASVRSIQFLSFIVLVFAWNGPLVCLIFLKNSLIFLLLLFSSISLHWSLRNPFFSLLATLWNSAFKWVYVSFVSPLLPCK